MRVAGNGSDRNATVRQFVTNGETEARRFVRLAAGVEVASPAAEACLISLAPVVGFKALACCLRRGHAMPDSLVDPPSGTIFNVHDASQERAAVTALLRRTGYTVVEMATGAEALKRVAEELPDLVILDVKLPDMDGFQVCAQLRRGPAARPVKVLHTSSVSLTTAKKVQSLDAGADGYLAEPFEEQELLATVRSLLRLKRAEEELRRRALQLRDADERKNEFLAMLAHELRNPLAAITVAVPMLREGVQPSAGQSLAVVERQARHLARLVDDLLDVARVTRGTIALQRKVVDLGVILESAVRTVRSTASEARQQELRLALPETPVWVEGDEARLEQLFVNLLHNASKYTPSGGHIVCELSVHPRAADQASMARIVVRDDGVGMTPKTLSRLFSVFSQGDVPLARSQGGLGVGLALARALVELHEGTIGAKSEGLGLGSEFEVRLPSVAPAVVEPAPSPALESVAPPADGRRIVVVDDNSDLQELLAMSIESWGYQVECASHGVEGLELIERSRPDVAVVDIGLPGIDGYEIARRVRADATMKDTTLVALTGYGSREQQAEALAAGFDAVLVKPVEAQELRQILAGGSHFRRAAG